MDDIENWFDDGLLLTISATTKDVQRYIHGQLPKFKVLSNKNKDITETTKMNLKT
ncbi:hypothetical protein HDV63DRAFT_374753 [Trichoderma sp. SZMC 28014]